LTRFVSFSTSTGDFVGFNITELAMFCTTKKGVRLLMKDGSYYDVQEDFSTVLNALLSASSNQEK